MKMQLFTLLLALPLAALAEDPESPINKVVTFINELKAEVTDDFKAENASWDKYKKWADDTIALAAKNIAEEEEIIEKATAKIEEMSGGKAASGAEIENAKKELKENAERTEEATSVFNKEKKEYEAAKKELTDSITALKAAKGELDKGHDKIAENKEESAEKQEAEEKAKREALEKQNKENAGFIQTGRRALQSAMKKLLTQPLVREKLSSEDLAVLTSLAKSPSKKQGFLQVDGPDTNGDYQESSGAAMGIIDTTLEDFEGDLKTANEEHAAKEKKFNDLIAELTQEKKDLEKFLSEQKSSNGESGKTLSEKKALKDDTQAELAANEKLKMNTEDSLKEKTYQYNTRVKLRLQELSGIDQAISILTSDDAKKTFEGAAKVNFLQMAREQTEEETEHQDVVRTKAYKVLKEISAQYHDLRLAQLAVRVKNAGHFDKVIDRIDRQIKHLREEEQEDVEHRDRCQEQQADNAAEIATLTDTAAKAGTLVSRLKEEAKEMQSDLEELRTEIKENEDDMKASEDERKEEREKHLVALKHDKEALALLEDAIVSIKAFYKDNKIAVLQQNAKEGKAPDQTAPDVGFDSKNYEGGKDSTKGLLGMMDMVREDMANEIKQGKAEDKKNQELFEKERMTMQELLDTQKKKEIESVKALAEKEDETSDKEDFKADTESSLDDANKEKESLTKDCAWVKTNFASRREKRKAEIEGLTEAKGLLAGASA